MRNNIFPLPILTILFFSFSANAQWVTNSNGINYNSGNVGIGTTSPLTLLQLRKDVGTAISSSHTYSNDISGIRFTNLSTVSNAGIVLNFQLGSTGTSHAAIAASRPSADHNILHFYTEHANSVAERMRINSNGNIGIGTTNPSVKLDISGSGTSTTVTRLSSGGHANYRQSRGSSSYDGGYLFYTGSTLDWRFQESANSSNLNIIDESLSTNVMTFQDNTGNVGISNSNPSEALDVVGTIKSDYLFLNSINSNEGGELLLDGAPGYTSWSVDNFQGKFRLHHSGTAFFSVASNGNVGIGTSSPDSKLAVNGTIHTKEVKVDLIGWSDFVFEDNYDLPSLTELESFILKNKHLPDVPTEAEVLENGIMLGEMNAKLLQKIEELTLYLIDQNKKIEELQKEVSELKEEK